MLSIINIMVKIFMWWQHSSQIPSKVSFISPVNDLKCKYKLSLLINVQNIDNMFALLKTNDEKINQAHNVRRM